jgi:hypothetical protein
LGVPDKDGVCPVKDLKILLKDGFKRFWGGRPDCIDLNRNASWCAEPRTDPLLGEQDQEWYAELIDYLKKELAQTDKSLPIVAAAYDYALYADARSAQIMNFVCGFERLGMSKRFVLFANNPAAYSNLVHNFPNTIVLYHPHMTKFAQAMAARTNLKYFSRLTKLVVAQMVLDAGRDVLITDTDIAWVRDSSEVFYTSGLDFAAMPDCPAINSGFVYYRNSPQARDLLHMTLSTWRESWLCADNDQYLLTCGWIRAAIKGLRYKVLPRNSWLIKCQYPMDCSCTESLKDLGKYEEGVGRQMSGIGDGSLFAFHTLGMTGPYTYELDMLAALNMVDVDFKTGQCKSGSKTIGADTWTKSCTTHKDGINHAFCDASCRKEPVGLESIYADLRSRGFNKSTYQYS